MYTMLNGMVLVSVIDDVATSEVEKNYADVARIRSNKGKIVAVSAGDPDLILGDVVLFSQHAANDVELDGEKYLMLHRQQIYLVLDGHNVATRQ
jgi:co-chaperonin GroES (HSP10)